MFRGAALGSFGNGDRVQVSKDRDGPGGPGDHVLAPQCHARGRDDPIGGVEVELLRPKSVGLARACEQGAAVDPRPGARRRWPAASRRAAARPGLAARRGLGGNAGVVTPLHALGHLVGGYVEDAALCPAELKSRIQLDNSPERIANSFIWPVAPCRCTRRQIRVSCRSMAPQGASPPPACASRRCAGSAVW